MLEDNAVLERHARLYFLDGDIILTAKLPSIDGQPPRYQAYRVHKPILRHHSSVFANLFADATVAAEDQTFDGVPLINMIGDDAEGFSGVLTFIYNPSEMHLRRWDPDTPLIAAPIVRLATKYLMDSLREHLIRKVVEDWPCTLADWDRQEAEIQAMREAPHNSAVPQPSFRPAPRPFALSVPEPAAAIRFALEFECHEILPAAFYQLSRTEVESDFDRPESFDKDFNRPARWSLLESGDLLCFLRGCGRLDMMYVFMGMADESVLGDILKGECRPQHWDYAPPEDGGEGEDEEMEMEMEDSASPCARLLAKLFAEQWDRRTLGRPDALAWLKTTLNWHDGGPWFTKESPDGLCARCIENLEEWVPKRRQSLWDSLSTYFEP